MWLKDAGRGKEEKEGGAGPKRVPISGEHSAGTSGTGYGSILCTFDPYLDTRRVV